MEKKLDRQCQGMYIYIDIRVDKFNSWIDTHKARKGVFNDPPLGQWI